MSQPDYVDEVLEKLRSGLVLHGVTLPSLRRDPFKADLIEFGWVGARRAHLLAEVLHRAAHVSCGTTVVDARFGRVGVVVGQPLDGEALVRPLDGGPAWPARTRVLRPASDREVVRQRALET